ncbi:hypothetical protein ACWD4B_31250 [Streptomyces sp. NPDC002536]
MPETNGQQAGAERELVLADIRDSGVSRATVRQSADGDLVLYCTDSGYAVMMQIGEHVREYRRWTTVAAADVPRLVDDPATVLETVREVTVVAGNGDAYANESAEIESRFAEWLRAHDVPFTKAREDYEG